MSIEIGLNMEFIRCEDKSFEAGVERAVELGYRWIEPMVHNGRELLSELGYFHSFSLDNDPHEMKDVLDRHGVKASALSAHCPLMRPEISVPYLEKAIRLAAVIGAPVVNTDEGRRPTWVDDDEALHVITYTLSTALRTAERYGISIGIEPHSSISSKTDGLIMIASLVDSDLLRINYDTGNAYLGGEDPYQGLRTVGDRMVHLHAKDITHEHSDAERGKTTGTPVGCACGDGVIDWSQVAEILDELNFSGVMSVECGTPAQAKRSLAHLREVLASKAMPTAS